jgi:hypothetical protein
MSSSKELSFACLLAIRQDAVHMRQYSLDIIAVEIIEQIQNPDHRHQSQIEFPHETLFLKDSLFIPENAVLPLFVDDVVHML